jgi:hypothetical protein
MKAPGALLGDARGHFQHETFAQYSDFLCTFWLTARHANFLILLVWADVPGRG